MLNCHTQQYMGTKSSDDLMNSWKTLRPASFHAFSGVSEVGEKLCDDRDFGQNHVKKTKNWGQDPPSGVH